MPIASQIPITRTPFKKQAEVIAAILRTNPIINDEDKSSLNETVGALSWLNLLQIHWADSKTMDIPENIRKQLFEGRPAQKVKSQVPA